MNKTVRSGLEQQLKDLVLYLAALRWKWLSKQPLHWHSTVTSRTIVTMAAAKVPTPASGCLAPVMIAPDTFMGSGNLKSDGFAILPQDPRETTSPVTQQKACDWCYWRLVIGS
jgi:hypothetical protein